MTDQERAHLIFEYMYVQEDLDAFLNVPPGMKLSGKYYATVRWLQNRLSQLKESLYKSQSA